MNHFPENSTELNPVVQCLLENGFEGAAEMFNLMANLAMKFERETTLNARAYERTDQRQGYANGFKNKTVKTRFGTMNLDIPQVRGEVDFYPSFLEKGLRCEKAINIAIAQMYVEGVSTRKVTNVLEKMCGLEVSRSQVSRACESLDVELKKWRERPLEAIPHVLVDARYEKVRVDGSVRSCALLTAFGVDLEGKRTVLGLSVSLSEAAVHWRKFLESLVKRGMHAVVSITSDAHLGLQEAIQATFPNVIWQRCQFHLQQNAQAYISKKADFDEVHDCIRDVFNAPSLEDAQRLLKQAVEKYSEKSSNLAEWMEEAIPQGLNIYSLDKKLWKKLRTTNMVENQNRQIKKRTKVISIFPNEDSLLRIASAILMQQDEEWQSSDRKYINLK